MRITSLAITISALLCVSGGILAQGPPNPSAQREAMKKLDVWAGRWKGKGWAMTGPGQRRDFEINETIEKKLDGLLMLVQGLGTSKDDSGKETVTHNALAVVSYDPDKKQYRFRHYTMKGGSGEDELKLTKEGYEWGFRNGEKGPLIRFVIKLDANHWHETGEISFDGKAWQQFLDMSLERQK